MVVLKKNYVRIMKIGQNYMKKLSPKSKTAAGEILLKSCWSVVLGITEIGRIR